MILSFSSFSLFIKEYRYLLSLVAFLFVCSFRLAAQTPIAHYPLNGNATDAGSNGLNGTIVGTVTPTTDRFGNANSAMQFGGGHVQLGSSFADQNFSISMWLKPGSSQVQFADILDNNHSNFQSWVLQQDGSILNRYVFGVHRSSGGLGVFFNLQADVWQHLVLVKSATTVDAYINGVLDQTTAWDGTVNYVSPFFRLGNWPGNDRQWNGGMDEVKYFNTALNQNQVTDLFNEGIPQPIAYYPFSGNANDEIGTNEGTVNGATLTTDRFGNANSAYSFDGVDDLIDIPTNDAIPSSGPVSVSAWINYTAGSGNLNWFKKGTGNGYGLYVQNGTIFVITFDVINWNTGVTISPDQWHQIVFTFDGTTQRIYKNGALAASIGAGYQPASNSAHIGRNFTGFEQGFFRGKIDELKIYNTALTGTQVLADYNASNSGAQQKPGSGNAISFDGQNDVIQVPNSTFNNFTMELWMNTSQPGPAPGGQAFSGVGILSADLGSTNSGDFIPMALNGNFITFGTGDGSDNTLTSNRPVVDGNWHHVAVTRNQATGEKKIYVDGILAGVGSGSSLSYNASSSLFIGADFFDNVFYHGQLDEIRIWNTALTQAQIRDRMCRKITSGDALFSNLVAYYNFDETSGNTVFDGTANANNGTLTNGPTRVTSGAAIGNTSAHHYVTSGFPSANLSINGQDNLAVAYTAGTFSAEAGTHIYAVSEKPNTETGIENPGSNDRYFGVFSAGITNPQYTATYNYTGNGFVTAGNESQLALFKRNDNAETTWANAGASLNTTANTLTATGQSTEYVLGIANCVTPPTPTISASGPTTFCTGDSVTLTSSAASGNLWSNGTTTQSIKIKAAGSFTVQVILAGCSSAVSAATSVTVNAPPSAAVITSPSGLSFCSGSSLTIQSDQSTLQQWQRNGSNINGQTGPSLVVSTPGTYTAVRTQNGCSSISNPLVISENTNVPATPTITSGGQTSFCANASLGLLSSATEGNQWTRNGTDINGATSNTFTATTAGTYAVRVTIGGCSRTSADLVINTLPAPTVNISASAPGICPSNPVVLSTTGTTLSAREWLKDGSSTGQFGPTFSASAAGSYSFIGTAANGCQTTSASLIVQADVVPVLTSNRPANTICNGNSITLTISPGAGFLWSNNATTSSITVSPANTSDFSVQTTGALGCVFNNSITVTVLPSLTPAQVSNMLPDNGSINQENTITFSWQPASNALAYDLYVWPAPGVRPGTPNATGITGISTELNNLNFGTLYNYQVVSRSACQTTDGPVQQFTTRSLPDLVVSNVQAQAVFGVPAQYTVTYTVTNQGSGVSLPGTWKDKLFLSLDSAEGADIELQVRDNLNALAPGASYNGSFQLVVDQVGEYFLYVKTDANSQIIETSEGNNLTFRNPGRVLFQEIIPTADLVSGPAGITTNPNAIAGGNVQFNYLVKNIGSAPAIGQASLVQCGPSQCNPIDLYWEDFAYVSPDSGFGPNAIPIGRVIVNPRKARAGSLPDCEECNGYYSTSRFLEVDSSMVAASSDLVLPHNITGKVFLIVKMNDGEGKFDERFKQNNLVISKGFNVILRPPADLQVNSVTLTPTSSQQGNFVKVKYRIKNIGVNSPITTEMQWTDKVYLSTSSVLDKNTAIVLSAKVFPLSFLGNNQQYDDSVTFQVPFLNTNPLFVFVEADAGNIVFEHTFKANNLSSANQLNLDLTKKPDYVPSGFTAPASVQAGSPISTSLTISNSGNANGNATFQTAFRLKLVGSPNTPTEISRAAASSLLISGNTVVSKNITIPAATAPGQYELSVFADADNTQPELNEGNNILTRTLTVTAAPAFDLGVTSISAPATVDIFQNQPNFQVGGEAFYNTIQSGPGLPTDITVKVLVSQNANGSNPLYSKETVLSFPSGVPATFTIPSQTINRNTVPQGDYFVVMELITGSTFETNQANNKLSKAIFFETSPTPDIVFATTPSTLTLVSGQAFSIPLEIKNTGVNELQGTCVTKAMLSNSPSTTNLSFNTVGTSAKIPGIFLMPTNQLVKDTIRGFIPLAYSGNYFLQLVTEADNKTYEGTAGELNNVITIPIIISPPVLPDLVVDPLVLPANIEAGRRISFNYTLRNNGLGSFSGGPKNTFRLSKTGVFNPLTDGDVGTDQPTVNLGPGANSIFPGALRANGLLPGAYKRGAFVNSTFTTAESNFANNETYSSGTSNLFINPLALDITASENGFIGDYFYRSVNIGAGFDILAEFTGQQGYASLGKVPTASASEFSSVDNLNKEILIPNSEAGQYFFGVAPNSTGPVTLKVRALPFSIISLSPNRVGKGNATTEIKGAAFTSQTIFVLRNAGGTNVDTGTIWILRSSMQARVTFHCTNLPIGFYTVRAIKPGNEFTDLVNGLQVVAKSGSGLVASNTMPEEVNSAATVAVNYVFTNAGNTDVENGFGRVSFPMLTTVKNITISSNADGYRSLLAKAGIYDLDKPLDYQVVDLFAIIPAWKRNIAPGESFQISFEMERFSNFSEMLVGSLAQDLGNEQFHDLIATEVEKVRGLSIQRRAEIVNTDILDSLGGYWSFQRLAFKNLRNSGFLTNSDLSEIAQRPYFPSVYQSGTMRGYGILYDTRVMEDLSLRYICEAPLSEYNLPTSNEIYTFSSDGALITYSSKYRRTAQDLIASACDGDTTEFKRRIEPLKNGRGFSGDLKTGFAYGPAIYTVVFGEYQPFQNSGSSPSIPTIFSNGGSFTGPGRNGSEFLKEPTDEPPTQPLPPPPPPVTPPPAQPDPVPTPADPNAPDYRKPGIYCQNVDPPVCQVIQTKPKTLRCKQVYTVCTFTFCNQNGGEQTAFCFPNVPFADEKCVKIRHSCDPNEIEGPEGFGESKFVAKTEVLPYTIKFENDPKFADAAASTVRIAQPLDVNFEQGTFRLKQFGFDNQVFDVPAGQSSFSTQIDLSAEKGIKVNVLGTIDIISKQLFWQFVTVDAATGQTSVDPSKGFLPVNDSTGKGEGFVSYTIQPGLATNTGDSLRAQAEIFFDFNEPILTNRHFNIVDALPPSTTLSSPSGTQAETDIAFEWTAADDLGGSGADRTWILFKKDAGLLDTLDNYPADTGAVVVSGFETGHTYQFFFRTSDHVGNLEALPALPNMTVTIGGTPCNDPAPTISAGGPTTFCAGGSVILTSSAASGNVWSNGETTQSITVSASATFSVKTVIEGCTSAISEPISVVVNPLPPKPTLTASGPLSFCQGGFVQLTTNAAAGHRWNTGATSASITITNSGTFADTAIALGCKNVSDPVTVTVNPKPSVFAGEDVTIEFGQFAFLTASGAVSYQWSPLVAISPPDGIGETVTVSPSQNTLYTVLGTDENNCTNTDQVLVTVTGDNNDPLVAPVITPPSGTYDGPQLVSISSSNPGATIYYTTSGNIPKVGTSFTKEYLGPFMVLEKTTVRAMAVKSGLENSPVSVSFIVISNPGVVANPVISPGSGTFEGAVSVSISCATPGASIWYTTNGNNPRFDVPNSFTKLYTGAFTLFGTTTIKTVATKTDFANSGLVSANFVVSNPNIVAAPTFTPVPGPYPTRQTVTISCATPGALIYFSNNGITPSNTTPAARLYTGPISVGATQQLKAIAYKDGFQPSAISVGNYTIGPVRRAPGDELDYYFENPEDQGVTLSNEIKLVPNPSQGRFSILSENPSEEASISIVNMLGQTIWEGKMEVGQKQLEIDFTRHAAGIYSLKYTSQGLKKEIRLIKN